MRIGKLKKYVGEWDWRCTNYGNNQMEGTRRETGIENDKVTQSVLTKTKKMILNVLK